MLAQRQSKTWAGLQRMKGPLDESLHCCGAVRVSEKGGWPPDYDDKDICPQLSVISIAMPWKKVLARVLPGAMCSGRGSMSLLALFQ